MTIEEKFHVLVALVENEGLKARAYFEHNENVSEQKADGSVVTQIDKDIEVALVTFIRSEFPDDTIRGEESEGYIGTSDFIWHIDPIDGTDNFLRRIPFFAISVARLGSTTDGSFAIIHNPITNQTFTALMDTGVHERSTLHTLNSEILGGRAAVAIARGRDAWMKPAGLNLQKAIAMDFGKAIFYSCTALELAYIASNRIDGIIIFGLSSYDYAAGLFLCKAGGGLVSVLRDGVWAPWQGSLKELCARHGEVIFVSHAGIHADALALIKNPRDWSDETA